MTWHGGQCVVYGSWLHREHFITCGVNLPVQHEVSLLQWEKLISLGLWKQNKKTQKKWRGEISIFQGRSQDVVILGSRMRGCPILWTRSPQTYWREIDTYLCPSLSCQAKQPVNYNIDRQQHGGCARLAATIRLWLNMFPNKQWWALFIREWDLSVPSV